MNDRRSATQRTLPFFTLGLCVLGCTHPTPPRGADLHKPTQAIAGVELGVEANSKGLPFVFLERSGDPAPAVACAFVVENSLQAAAIAAVLEARLAGHGVDVVADRHSVRIRALVTKVTATELMSQFYNAIGATVVEGSAEHRLAMARTAALTASVLDDPSLDDIAECGGWRTLAPGEKMPELSGRQGVATLNAWRDGAMSRGRVSVGAVGAESLRREVAAAVSSWAFPEKPPATSVQTPRREVFAYVATGVAAGNVRLQVALRGNAAEVAELARRAGDPSDALARRLAGLAAPFRVIRSGAWSAKGHHCALIETEAQMSSLIGDIEAVAAVATGIIESSARVVNTPWFDPRPRIIRSLEDPRDAAAAAAWWALSRDEKNGERRWTVALGEPAPPARPGSDVPSMQAQTQRFQAAVTKVRASQSQPIVELRGATERGQSELWALAATPCAVAERAGEVGLTSSVLVSQLISTATRDGVSLEPWVDADGAGYFAHAMPREGESAEQLARRVANALGEVLFVHEPTRWDHERTQISLLERASSRSEMRSFQLATWLAPLWPSRLAPLGSPDSLARAGYSAVLGRFHALASAPIRVAVLAPDSAEQPSIVRAELDALTTRTGEPRTCPPIAPESAPDVAPHSWGFGASAVAMRIDVQGNPLLADITLEMLSATDGALRRSLPSSVSCSIQRTDGGSLRSWQLFLSGDPAEVDAAISKVREHVTGLAKGAATQEEFDRAWAVVQQQQRRERSTRSFRVVDLWRGGVAPATPTIDALRSWQTSNLRAESLVIVRPAAP